MTLRPMPGFNWQMVAWGAPDEPRTEHCSYCSDKLPTEDEDPDFIPLILWNGDGWTAEFCDHCAATWFGVRTFKDPVQPRKEAS